MFGGGGLRPLRPESYKWRPIRWSHMIHHHLCLYGHEQRPCIFLWWWRPWGASRVWKLKSKPPLLPLLPLLPSFVSYAGVFNQIWPMGNTDPLHANPPALSWWQAFPWQRRLRRQRGCNYDWSRGDPTAETSATRCCVFWLHVLSSCKKLVGLRKMPTSPVRDFKLPSSASFIRLFWFEMKM